MKQQNNDIALGRFISLVLRHEPTAAGIHLDENGWADVDALIGGINRTGRFINRKILERIVKENNKKRYSFNEEHTKIRANQGHSIAVDVELKTMVPPDILYHGTAVQFLDNIMKEGLQKQSRQYVHLSELENTARQVGSRHGKPIVLRVNAAAMTAAGYQFWLSENGVWLCTEVPAAYIWQ